jgi:hypothetical protein
MFNQYIYNKEFQNGEYIGGTNNGNLKSQIARRPSCYYKGNKAVDKKDNPDNTAFIGWNSTSLRNLSGDLGIKNRKKKNKIELCQAVEPFKKGNILGKNPEDKWNDFLFPDTIKRTKLINNKITDVVDLIPSYKDLYDADSRRGKKKEFGTTLSGFNYLHTDKFKTIPQTGLYRNYPSIKHIKNLLEQTGQETDKITVDNYLYNLNKRLDRIDKIKKPKTIINTTQQIKPRELKIKKIKSVFKYKIPKKSIKINLTQPKNINIDDDNIPPPKIKPYELYTTEKLLSMYNRLIENARYDPLIEDPRIRRIKKELQKRNNYNIDI